MPARRGEIAQKKNSDSDEVKSTTEQAARYLDGLVGLKPIMYYLHSYREARVEKQLCLKAPFLADGQTKGKIWSSSEKEQLDPHHTGGNHAVYLLMRNSINRMLNTYPLEVKEHFCTPESLPATVIVDVMRVILRDFKPLFFYYDEDEKELKERWQCHWALEELIRNTWINVQKSVFSGSDKKAWTNASHAHYKSYFKNHCRDDIEPNAQGFEYRGKKRQQQGTSEDASNHQVRQEPTPPQHVCQTPAAVLTNPPPSHTNQNTLDGGPRRGQFDTEGVPANAHSPVLTSNEGLQSIRAFDVGEHREDDGWYVPNWPPSRCGLAQISIKANTPIGRSSSASQNDEAGEHQETTDSPVSSQGEGQAEGNIRPHDAATSNTHTSPQSQEESLTASRIDSLSPAPSQPRYRPGGLQDLMAQLESSQDPGEQRGLLRSMSELCQEGVRHSDNNASERQGVPRALVDITQSGSDTSDKRRRRNEQADISVGTTREAGRPSAGGKENGGHQTRGAPAGRGGGGLARKSTAPYQSHNSRIQQ